MDIACVVCGARADGLCRGCREALAAPPAVREPNGVDSLCTVFAYDGVGKDLLGRLKFDNRRSALAPLVRAAAPWLPAVDLVVPVPVLPDRRRARGYSLPDQIALTVAARVRRPKRTLLRRVDHASQQGRSRQERLGAANHRSRRTAAKRILLVDDVITTGGTLVSCAAALRDVAVEEVHALVLAGTPESVR